MHDNVSACLFITNCSVFTDREKKMRTKPGQISTNIDITNHNKYKVFYSIYHKLYWSYPFSFKSFFNEIKSKNKNGAPSKSHGCANDAVCYFSSQNETSTTAGTRGMSHPWQSINFHWGLTTALHLANSL